LLVPPSGSGQLALASELVTATLYAAFGSVQSTLSRSGLLALASLTLMQSPTFELDGEVPQLRKTTTPMTATTATPTTTLMIVPTLLFFATGAGGGGVG
jgi:hypothetical protein